MLCKLRIVAFYNRETWNSTIIETGKKQKYKIQLKLFHRDSLPYHIEEFHILYLLRLFKRRIIISYRIFYKCIYFRCGPRWLSLSRLRSVSLPLRCLSAGNNKLKAYFQGLPKRKRVGRRRFRKRPKRTVSVFRIPVCLSAMCVCVRLFVCVHCVYAACVGPL